MSSYGTNEPSGLEVEPSTAGATGGDDHGWVVNLAELSAWLIDDDEACKRFTAWLNAKAAREK